MGIFATSRRHSPWAQDPEALLVFTLEVARNDPRLFDELLDWLVVNDSLLSGWRTRAMCKVPGDDELVAAALAWVARHGGRDRGLSKRDGRSDVEQRPLFRGLSIPISEPDEAFAGRGLLRPVVTPSGKSQPPDLSLPVNLAFRLRQVFGVTARAEIARCLLTMDARRVSSGVLARAASYTVRNVSDALSSLQSASIVGMTGVGSEQYYSVDQGRWGAFLGIGPDDFPDHRDWPQLLVALRRILRWLWDTEVEQLSEYMLASRARDLLEEVHPDLAYAGVPVEFGRSVDDALDALATTLDRAVDALGARRTEAGPVAGAAPYGRGTLDVYQDQSGEWRWRLKAGNGQIVAVSPDSFRAERSAVDAARHFADRAPELDPDIYVDSAGAFRWRVRAGNQRIVASSGVSFTTRSNARRAADSARRIVRATLRA